MKAWNAACNYRGTSKLLIPGGTYMAGQVAFQGPCNSPNPVTVEVQGIIKAQTDISEYSSQEWFSFESINGLVVTGGGTFDGQGAAVWKYNDCHQHSDCQLLPTSLKFSKVTNAVIENIKSVNSKSFHMAVNQCQGITAHRLNIIAPYNSPNTDGIHISSSDSINVTSSFIGTGDDCISIGQGATHVFISNITCGPGHGISVGSLGKYPHEKDVTGIIVKNCTLTNTTNGARIKTWPGSPPSTASSIRFEDLIMESVKNPVIIDQQYGSRKKKNSSRVKISDVHFKNIRGTSTTNIAVSILCSQAVPCEGVEIVDIDLAYKGAKTKDTSVSSTCSNAKVSFVGKQSPPACN